MRAQSTIALFAVLLCLSTASETSAADRWIEVKSEHFTVVSNASERSARTLVWQLEQVRSVMVTLWSWARVDLNKPLSVIAVKDENAMRVMAPRYWEERGGIRPSSVWVTGADRHYLTIRADVEVETQGTVNPHLTAYFSYINLVMAQTLSPDLTLWLSRGLSGVLSNTLVKNDHIVLGAPIPWHLEALRGRARMSLDKLLTITRLSPEFRRNESQAMFDAQAWAFVHFLMFSDNRARAGKLDAFAKLVSEGKDASHAFRETLGPPENLEGDFRGYFERKVYLVARFNIDVAVERERFPIRALSAAESASARAHFHVAMRRSAEARAAIAEARKADPKAPGSYDAEGILLDLENKPEEAKLAFTKAAESGSSNAYVHYRLASLTWRRDANRDTLKAIEAHLAKATASNNRYAHAYSWLGEIRSSLGTGDPVGLVMRAISLEPLDAQHRVRAAVVFARQQQYDDARVHGQAALSLADTDEDRRRAQEVLDWIAKTRRGD